MKFKKYLAVMLSAAMMVTSVNVTGLADLTTVMAATTGDVYNYTVKSGGKVLAGYVYDKEYTDAIYSKLDMTFL